MSVSWLIFDAMGVIFEVGDDIKDLLVPYVIRRKPAASEQQILDLYMKASLGEINSQGFWQSMGFKNWQDTEKDYLDNCLTLDKDFCETAQQLQRKYNLALLSNDISEWSVHLRRKFNLDQFFKTVIISGDVGYRKPNPKIYEFLLTRINAPAGDCLFFDDRVKNLFPAQELGITPVLFNRERIDARGFKSVDGFREIEKMIDHDIQLSRILPYN